MTEVGVENRYLEHLVEYQVAICKECRYGIWPDHIQGHLQGIHKVSCKDAESAGKMVRSWPGLVRYPSELELPSGIVEPIRQVPLYRDGLLCRLEPARCRHVLRSEEAMKKHWHEFHGWSAGRKRGRPSRVREKSVQEQVKKAFHRVHCQRLFVQGRGSQYFEVRQPVEGQQEEDDPEPVAANNKATWARMCSKMAKKWADVETRARTTIQHGEKDEVNPWLDRTQWPRYLEGLQWPDLLACVEEPNSDPKKEEEPVEAAIWEAMDGLARISQASVMERTGVFVRMEAIRTEKHQTRYQPLQPYMDEKSIGEHARPWKQMLMFFARTQREHEWKSPKYRFTRRQREAWEALVEQATQKVKGDEDTDDEDIVIDEMEEDEMAIDEMEDGEEGDEMEVTGGRTENTPEGLTKIQKACLRLCIELLNQSITRKEYDSPLVCALAVLGVKECGWKGPEQYPPILSAVIKVARFMVVQQALELSEPFREDEFDGDSAYESDDGGAGSLRPRRKGCLQFVQDMMDKFMVRGSHGPMQWMLDLRTYGLKIHYNTTSRGHVEWKGHDELLYKGLHFNMAQFRSMIHGLVTESRRLLLEELLFFNRKTASQVPEIPWNELRDNPTDERPGWNFLKDHRTRLPVDGETWLFDRVGREAALRGRFLKPGSRSGINRQGVESYMARVMEFREKLLVLMHIVSGQPARGPEVLSIRHSNTVKGGHRNIFIEDGMVVFVTRYHKGYAVSGDVKIIHRYLPREVGELWVWYMWLVLPFQQRWEAMVWEKEAMSSHMWPADPSGRKWTSERMRHVLKRESSAGLGQEFTIQSYRQIAIGISRRFMRGPTAFGDEDGDENEEWNEDNIAAVIADEQAGHTSYVAGLVYARAIMEQAGAVADKRQQFRASSMDWHRFLGFQSAVDDGTTSKKRKRAPFETEAEDGRIDRWVRLRKMDGAAQLKRMMGKEAVFRGVQEEAIEAITAGESPVVAVMPTGAGKSMLFMLPAWAEQGGTTVVVVPLIALRGDMMRRCKKLGISCEEWEGRRPPDAAAIVLVTPESAVSEEFMTFLNRLRATRQLDRIVIDECHIVLNRRYKFRKQMQQLGKLVAAETQMVLLTATLPPTEEEELYRRMYFNKDQVKRFRAMTARVNVAYRVVRVGIRAGRREEREEVVLELIRRKMRKYKTGKVVVYCNAVGKVKRFAKALGCGAYHHDAVGKDSMLKEFMEGGQRVIVATSSLGMGVDIPDIRCIIHVDQPRTLLDYAQESGRAGRDGLRSEAIVIDQHGWNGCRDEEQTEEERQLVETYVQGENEKERCRRVVLDGYLDGRKDRVGCEEGEELCDVCGGVEGEIEQETDEEVDEEAGEEVGGETGEEDLEAERERERDEVRREFQRQEQERRGPQNERIRRRQQEFMEMEWLRRQLQWWAGRCAICKAAGTEADNHDLRQCWRQESQIVKEKVKMIEDTIRFEDYSGCFWCGVPQEVCNRWEDDGRGGYQRVQDGCCQYMGVLVASVVGLVFGYQEQVGEQWRQRVEGYGVDIRSDESLIYYLGRKRQSEVVESSNLVGEFCWITGLVAE
jgi:superfamily II DNA helicase RecQ